MDVPGAVVMGDVRTSLVCASVLFVDVAFRCACVRIFGFFDGDPGRSDFRSRLTSLPQGK